ncbi:MAG: type II toxin-antitoxin system VapC family toxin [Oscillospiraceae bacterium]|nr:type II toxin-antitoxin system VapC family toxin [Oscillospiraceae bacterium]
MRLLLDTHTVLWMVNEHEKLSSTAKAFLRSDEHTLFVSIASLWEMAIKISLGKLSEMDGGVGLLLSKIQDMPIELLPITTDHIEAIETLPFIHRDPFDRMLVATAMVSDMTILTSDENIPRYGVPCAR